MNLRRSSATVLVAVGVTLVACEEPAGRTAGPSTTGASAPAAGCSAAAPGAAAAAPEVVPGPINGVPPATAAGEPLVIDAVVLGAACLRAEGANVHLWHTDAQGRYGPAVGPECCYYDGTVTTDDAGRFRVRSIRPAQYPGAEAPPAHIHVEIRYGGTRLDTEIVFGDDPPPAVAPPTGPVLPVVLTRDGAGWRGEATFVLNSR